MKIEYLLTLQTIVTDCSFNKLSLVHFAT